MFLGAWHCDQSSSSSKPSKKCWRLFFKRVFFFFFFSSNIFLFFVSKDSFLLIFMEIIEKSCRFFLGFILFLRVIFFSLNIFFEFYWHRIIFVILALARSQLLSYVQSFQSVNTGEYGIWSVLCVGPTADEKLIIGFPCSLCPVLFSRMKILASSSVDRHFGFGKSTRTSYFFGVRTKTFSGFCAGETWIYVTALASTKLTQ